MARCGTTRPSNWSPSCGKVMQRILVSLWRSLQEEHATSLKLAPAFNICQTIFSLWFRNVHILFHKTFHNIDPLVVLCFFLCQGVAESVFSSLYCRYLDVYIYIYVECKDCKASWSSFHYRWNALHNEWWQLLLLLTKTPTSSESESLHFSIKSVTSPTALIAFDGKFPRQGNLAAKSVVLARLPISLLLVLWWKRDWREEPGLWSIQKLL